MEFEFLAVKAVGDWELDVLALPYDKRDSDNQFFDAQTDTMEAQFNNPAIIYHHGVMPGKGKIEKKPVIIGKALSMEKQADGLHIRVLLDKAVEYAARVWEAAKKGLAVASSDSIAHLARLEVGGKLQMYEKDKPGRIAVWPLAGLSLWDMAEGNFQPASRYAIALPAMKAIYRDAGLQFPEFDDTDGGLPDADNDAVKRAEIVEPKTQKFMENKMDEKLLTPEQVQAQIDAALVAHDAALKAAADQKAAIEAEVEKRANEKLEAYKAEAAKSRRLDFDGQAPHQTEYADTNKYDNLSPGEIGLAIDFMKSTGKFPQPTAALKALALRLIEDKRDLGGRELAPEYSRGAMKAAGLSLNPDAYKAATDPMYTGGSTDGGNWVHTAYTRELWSVIRASTGLVSKIPTQIIPDGYKSATIPIEGTDLTWYSAPEVTTTDSTYKFPLPTIDGTQITTPTNKEITVAKMGARGYYSGEMTEDSIINFVPQLRAQLEVSGAEQLEHAVIDGDTETGASTNINKITGTPTSTGTARDLYLIMDGFRKYALVTAVATNARAGGALSEDDYLETMWLIGTAGLGGSDLQKSSFLVDPNTYKKSLQMAVVKTQDVWANATLEGGALTRLWGYDLTPSWFMNYKSSTRKSNTAGKVDQVTAANNAYGTILGIRWDQWKFAYKRQMTIETTRIANADAYEIVAWARVGMNYRDATNAAAATYGITV